MDPRYAALAHCLIERSLSLKGGENILIDATDVPASMVNALIASAKEKNAFAFVSLQSSQINRQLFRAASERQLRTLCEFEMARMQAMDAYISLRAVHNSAEYSDVPGTQIQLVNMALAPVTQRRVNNTRWVIVRWPTSVMAQAANMSIEAFEEFFFNVCTVDYSSMRPGMLALKNLLMRTRNIRIEGPGTNLRFSIEGLPAVACAGERNLPDGEVFTAPIRDSVEGTIHFNAPTVYRGASFDSISMVFRNGKIVDATARDARRLNEILDADPGGRYLGEFGIGLNPYITKPLGDILFDEKIAGSLHLAAGQAFPVADNGNRSGIHWDLVCIQRPGFGGGRIYFDDHLVREDGVFVGEELKCLNWEAAT